MDFVANLSSFAHLFAMTNQELSALADEFEENLWSVLNTAAVECGPDGRIPAGPAVLLRKCAPHLVKLVVRHKDAAGKQQHTQDGTMPLRDLLVATQALRELVLEPSSWSQPIPTLPTGEGDLPALQSLDVSGYGGVPAEAEWRATFVKLHTLKISLLSLSETPGWLGEALRPPLGQLRDLTVIHKAEMVLPHAKKPQALGIVSDKAFGKLLGYNSEVEEFEVEP